MVQAKAKPAAGKRGARDVPDRIGKYVIINEVGQGSTGRVFLSHDPYYGRDVAIKLYNIDGEEDQKARVTRKMFFNEAQMMGRLQHPNILPIYDAGEEKLANVVFAPIHDRRGRSILSVRDQNTFADSLRKKRLMTLVHLFLVHRFKADSVHYVTPTEDNQYQVEKMTSHGIFSEVNTEVGQIIVANVNRQRISAFLAPDQEELGKLIRKER